MGTALYMSANVFIRRFWWQSLLAISLLVGIPLSVRSGLSMTGRNIFTGMFAESPFDYFFIYLSLSSAFLIMVSIFHLDAYGRYFQALPISAPAFVSAINLTITAFALVFSLIINVFYRILYFDSQWLSDYWPLMGPEFFLVTLVLVIHCIFWNMQTLSMLKLLFWALALTALGWWFMSRFYPDGFQKQIVPWCRLTTVEWIVLATISLVSWWISVISFAEVRCGNTVNSQAWQRLSLLVEGHSHKVQIDRDESRLTAAAAFSRLHWQDSCSGAVRFAGIVAGAGAFVVCLVVFIQGSSQSGQPLRILSDNAFMIFNLLVVMSATTLGILLGQGLNNEKNAGMKSWLRVVPLSDFDLSAVLLQNLVKTAAVILSLVLLGFGLSYLIVEYFFESPTIQRNDISQVFLVGIFEVVVFWVLAANLVSVMWTGRNWFIFSVAVVFMSFLFAIPLLDLFFLSPAEMQLIGPWLVTFLVLFLISGCIAAFALAYRKKLIHLKTVLISLMFYGIAVLLCYPVWNVISISEKVFCSAILLPIFIPFATIPLAVSWNRHR